MSDFATLMKAVLAAPDDDLPRLVLADWLEEHGQPERGQWLRHSVLGGRPVEFPEGAGAGFLLAAGTFGERCEVDLTPPTPGVTYTVRRGFVETVACRWANWFGGECWRWPTDELNTAGAYHANLRALGLECPGCDGSGIIPAMGSSLVTAHPVALVKLLDAVDHLPLAPAFSRYAVHRDTIGDDLFDSAFADYPGPGEGSRYVLSETADPLYAALSPHAIAWTKAHPNG